MARGVDSTIQGVMRHLLRPIFDRVIIKELDPDRVRRSGLVVPPGSHEPPPHHGIVLAVGPGLDWWEGAGVDMPVKPGDHVVFPASAGSWVEVDEERLLVCRVDEILGVMEELSSCPYCGDRGISSEEEDGCPVCGRKAQGAAS
jgi:chaperonin GroES